MVPRSAVRHPEGHQRRAFARLSTVTASGRITMGMTARSAAACCSIRLRVVRPAPLFPPGTSLAGPSPHASYTSSRPAATVAPSSSVEVRVVSNPLSPPPPRLDRHHEPRPPVHQRVTASDHRRGPVRTFELVLIDEELEGGRSFIPRTERALPTRSSSASSAPSTSVLVSGESVQGDGNRQDSTGGGAWILRRLEQTNDADILTVESTPERSPWHTPWSAAHCVQPREIVGQTCVPRSGANLCSRLAQMTTDLQFAEPPVGIEPTTYALRGCRSMPQRSHQRRSRTRRP